MLQLFDRVVFKPSVM